MDQRREEGTGSAPCIGVCRSVGCSGSGSTRRDEFKGKHGGVTRRGGARSDLARTGDEAARRRRGGSSQDESRPGLAVDDTGSDKTGQGWTAATGVGDGTTRLREWERRRRLPSSSFSLPLAPRSLHKHNRDGGDESEIGRSSALERRSSVRERRRGLLSLSRVFY
ncbi:hypothetical protein PIB30_060953 [Stylosanthes scabra]|uniref:Uncharacterized protein n=1 Tax=Stylosanthes scabra TaxID=79078 RepID=A0ABU6ZJE0_9FABA|nr:hypothetical protein [Stylosanthes scabra]